MTTIGKLSKFNILQLFPKQYKKINTKQNINLEQKFREWKKKNHIKYSNQIVYL